MGGKLLRRLRFQMLCLSMNWLSLIYAICFEHIHLYCSLKRQAVHSCAQMQILRCKMLVGKSQTLSDLHRSGAGCAIASLNKKSRQLQVEMKLAVLFKSFLLIDQLQTHNFEVDKIKTFCIFMVVSFCSASELSAKTTNIDFQFTRGNRTVFIQ